MTHPFAALTALDGRSSMPCQYVGRLPAAKDYGTFPMYVLKHRDRDARTATSLRS